MCGIHFILDKKKKIKFKPIWNMVNTTLYRGEGRGVVKFIIKEDYQLFFGHNYLRITDVGIFAQQPFTTEKYPDSQLIFNGEIYNHFEIRKRWILTDYDSLSDTVTLFYFLQAFGGTGVPALNGMFAFIFWDGLKEELIIARDARGIKPLYYFENEDFLIVSSESKAIIASGLISKKLDPKQVSHYLSFKFAESDASFFENIQEVEKKAIWVYSPKENWKRQRPEVSKITQLFRSFSPSTSTNVRDIIQELDKLLFHTILGQLPSEFPRGLFLSGGVDSTLLLAYIQETSIGSKEIDFPCFTIVNTQDKKLGTQDAYYAHWACQKFGGKPYTLEVDENILWEFPKWIQCLDEPIGDGAMFLTWLLAREAQKEVRVVFSGAGADELFAGYRRHQAFAYYQKYRPWFQRFPPHLIKPFFPKNSFPYQILNKINENPTQTFQNFTKLNIQNPEVRGQRSEVGSRKSDSSNLTPHSSDSPPFSPLLHDQENYLPSDVLKLTDLMTMQFQIEARVPYLDDKIVRFANTYPWQYWLQYGKKWVLKELLTQKGGAKIANRKKEGFGVPLTEWLKHPKFRDLWQPILNQNSVLYEYMNYQLIQDIIQSYFKGKGNFNQEVWAILVLTWWLEENFH